MLTGYGASDAVEQVEHEPGRFVVRVGALEAFLAYEERDGVLDLQHTYTPPALRGRQLAAALTEAAFAYAQAHALRVLPTCSYTQDYVARHPHLRSITRSP